jgi:hypothetical protein
MNGSHKMLGAALVLLGAQTAAIAGISPDAAQDLAKKSGLWAQQHEGGSQHLVRSIHGLFLVDTK